MAGTMLPWLPPRLISCRGPPLQLTPGSRNLLSLPRASSKDTSAALCFLHCFQRVHIAQFLISTSFVQNERDTSFKSSNACLQKVEFRGEFMKWVSLSAELGPLAYALNGFLLFYLSSQRRMGLLANAFHGALLICLLLGSFNDVAAARAAVFGMTSSSEERTAEQQQVEPKKGNCATCLGVVDETLGACGAALNCVSTFDDRPSFFIAPWEFNGKLSTAFQQMKHILMKEGGDIVEQGNRYLHVVFTDKDGTIDDLELLFSIPSEDLTVNIRSASRKFSQNDSGRNQKRLERIRQALMWEEVPVLRNRSRKLFFLESPWDTFGPEPPPAFDYENKLDFVPD